ncbi:trbL/VirB6 plasmid conjugal transfer family protein [Orientia chuto str. Dubai]|uniref:TrbL/VirB6 plasmid conjugal transfer family protein n=1 Tax=Orientia chuto str. Dubai TaxID=1359168 RepID=A0A0F3MRG5_9RICK|nr:type IV secretion system protein [Candidatus Orientia mediorientalis]KJV57184.1 trbL/VirB6 plasmid conjugal transfer family protein [Orientia chuto str. Dubai]
MRLVYQLAKIFILILVFISQAEAVKAIVGLGDILPDEVKDVADEVKDGIKKVVDTLSNLTCETRGVNALLFKDEFSHTCTPAPFFSLATASIIGIGTYLPMVLKLNMTNGELFNEKFPGGQCLKTNRADPANPQISFALCNNVKLIAAAAGAVAETIINVAVAVASGDNVWDAVARAWNIKPQQIFEVYYDKEEGYSGSFIDINLAGSPYIPYKVVRDKDKICVAAWTILGGYLNVGCKYISEPCTRSIYSNFLNNYSNVSNLSEPICYTGNNKDSKELSDKTRLVECANMKGCYTSAAENSKTLLPITGPIVTCFVQMAHRILGESTVCKLNAKGEEVIIQASDSNMISNFSHHMRRAVTAFMCLYIIFWGYNIVLSRDEITRKDVINSVLKIVLVTYFSIGISTGDGRIINGVQKWGMELLSGDIMAEVAAWVMTKSNNEEGKKVSGLCSFQASDYDASKNSADARQFLALWDSIDCRLTHYLGINAMKDYIRQKVQAVKGGGDPLGNSIPPYYYLLIPALWSGNMTLLGLVLFYPLLVISIAAYMVNAYIVCIIGILILGLLAPIFVPMVLFEYTRNYFHSWLKLVISFVLQPMVVIVFMMMMFHVYEYGFYTDCAYDYKLVKEHSSIMFQGQEKCFSLMLMIKIYMIVTLIKKLLDVRKA